MRIINISLGNLKRRKLRSLLLLLSIVIGVASSVFLFTTVQVMEEDVSNKIDQFGSNLLILPGFALGMGLAMEFGSLLAQMSLQVPFQPILALYSLLIAVVVSLVASVYPVWKATKLEPVDALRYF
ncbi:MAG: hypothetical protein GX958_01555 [Desulfitobacterium sp.]|nr:hypothetical protein [Desulfitobacterium sp.]